MLCALAAELDKAVMLITMWRFGDFPGRASGNTRPSCTGFVMPILTKIIGLIPPMVRSLRAALLEVYGSDYFVCREDTGFHGGELTRWFVLRNASGPLVTVAIAGGFWFRSGRLSSRSPFVLPGYRTRHGDCCEFA